MPFADVLPFFYLYSCLPKTAVAHRAHYCGKGDDDDDGDDQPLHAATQRKHTHNKPGELT